MKNFVAIMRTPNSWVEETLPPSRRPELVELDTSLADFGAMKLSPLNENALLSRLRPPLLRIMGTIVFGTGAALTGIIWIANLSGKQSGFWPIATGVVLVACLALFMFLVINLVSYLKRPEFTTGEFWQIGFESDEARKNAQVFVEHMMSGKASICYNLRSGETRKLHTRLWGDAKFLTFVFGSPKIRTIVKPIATDPTDTLRILTIPNSAIETFEDQSTAEPTPAESKCGMQPGALHPHTQTPQITDVIFEDTFFVSNTFQKTLFSSKKYLKLYLAAKINPLQIPPRRRWVHHAIILAKKNNTEFKKWMVRESSASLEFLNDMNNIMTISGRTLTSPQTKLRRLHLPVVESYLREDAPKLGFDSAMVMQSDLAISESFSESI